jgi:hypothetical protein
MAWASGDPIFFLKEEDGGKRRIDFPPIINDRDIRDGGSNRGGYSLLSDPSEQCESLSLELEVDEE